HGGEVEQKAERRSREGLLGDRRSFDQLGQQVDVRLDQSRIDFLLRHGPVDRSSLTRTGTNENNRQPWQPAFGASKRNQAIVPVTSSTTDTQLFVFIHVCQLGTCFKFSTLQFGSCWVLLDHTGSYWV